MRGSLGRAQPIRPPGSTEEPWGLGAAAAAAARHNNRHREVAQRGVGRRVLGTTNLERPFLALWQSRSVAV